MYIAHIIICIAAKYYTSYTMSRYRKDIIYGIMKNSFADRIIIILSYFFVKRFKWLLFIENVCIYII